MSMGLRKRVKELEEEVERLRKQSRLFVESQLVDCPPWTRNRYVELKTVVELLLNHLGMEVKRVTAVEEHYKLEKIGGENV